MKDAYESQMMFGNCQILKFPDIFLTIKENPEKISLRKLVPTERF